jgi:hypothetical protein
MTAAAQLIANCRQPLSDETFMVRRQCKPSFRPEDRRKPMFIVVIGATPIHWSRVGSA